MTITRATAETAQHRIFFHDCFHSSERILLNIIIAIILDNFAETSALEDAKVQPWMLDVFNEVWEKYDPRATHKVPYDLLKKY